MPAVLFATFEFSLNAQLVGTSSNIGSNCSMTFALKLFVIVIDRQQPRSFVTAKRSTHKNVQMLSFNTHQNDALKTLSFHAYLLDEQHRCEHRSRRAA
jgi:hypothetical protein